MKLKTLIVILFNFIISISFASAQLPSVKGEIIDSASNQPLDYVTVSIKNPTNSIVKSAFTDAKGHFKLEKLSFGDYILYIAPVGFFSKTISISLINSPTNIIDLGKILLFKKNLNLNEVVITANKQLIRQEVDRTIYDVQADPDSKALNMLDILRKVPLISLNAEDNILLRGKSDFKILINGKVSNIITRNPQDVLRTMPASSIQRVEVITNPPAKYDSEGIAGIINIITYKRINDGYSGSVGLMYNSLRSTVANNLINVKSGKIAFSSNIGKAWRDFPGSTYSNNRNMGINFVQSRVEQVGSNLNKYGDYLYSFSDFSYEFDSLNLIAGTIGLESLNGNQRKNQLLRSLDQNGNLNKSYGLNNLEYSGGKEINVSINYELGFKRNKEQLLTASYLYSNIVYNIENENIFSERLNFNDNDFKQQNESAGKEQTVQLDYVHQIKKINIEGGIKFISRDNYSDIKQEDFDSSNNQFIPNINLSNKFDYLQNVLSFYNSYRLDQEKWSMKLGVRFEKTTIDADYLTYNTNLKTKFLNLIPSASFQFKLNDVSNFNLGYTQRIQRPGIGELNPFENKSNPFYYTSGNPDLIPVLAHNFELSYSKFKKGFFSVGVNYSFSKNTIQNVFSLGIDSIGRSKYYNLGKNYDLGMNFNLNYPVTNKLNIKLSELVSYLKINGSLNGQKYENNGMVFSSNNSLNYNFGKNWRTSLNFGFLSNSVTFQGETNGNFYSGANLSKDIFLEKLTLFVSVTNPFQKFRESRSQLNSLSYVEDSRYVNLNRSFRINLSYRFGRLKDAVKKNKRGVSNDDVKNNSL